MEKLTWRDVFDGYKFVKRVGSEHTNIYDVNSFVYVSTLYKYFAFNGRIYKVDSPEEFNMETADSGLIIYKL